MNETTRYARIVHGGVPTYFQVPPSGPVQQLAGPPWEELALTGATISQEAFAAASGSRLCPVAPSKIIGIGRNYQKHAAELNNEVPEEPLMFFKPPSCLLEPGGTVVLPPESSRVDYEAELAVVIGRTCRRVTDRQALDFVFGYTLACDVTARDLQKSDAQWTRGKGFDTFCPIGPDLVRTIDPANVELELQVDQRTKQKGSTRDMIFAVPRLVSYVSQCMTLEPGDVILTGTPEGVGPLRQGNRVRISGSGLTDLQFNVEKEAQ